MAALCGKSFSSEDRKVWQQAIALLVGLKIRNSLGENDLAAAVETALLQRAVRGNSCEDCGLKVTSGAAIAQGGAQGGRSGPVGLAIPKPPGSSFASNLLQATYVLN